jgi:cell division septation protein DedD
MVDPILLNSNQQGRNKNKKIAIIIGIVFAVVLVGGILTLRQSKKGDQTKIAVVEKKEPSPTEKPKIDKSSVKVQVLNGTGTPGQAGTVVEALKEAGYSADNITSANADAFDSTITTITARKGFEDIASDIKDNLKSVFDEINIDSSKLDEKSEFDIVVVTGGEKFEETPTTTVTPTENPTPSPTSETPTPTPTPTITPTPTPIATPIP